MECPICLEEIKANQINICCTNLKVKHHYHNTCILILKSSGKKECPICKMKLENIHYNYYKIYDKNGYDKNGYAKDGYNIYGLRFD